MRCIWTGNTAWHKTVEGWRLPNETEASKPSIGNAKGQSAFSGIA
jgi:hypothetical protein